MNRRRKRPNWFRIILLCLLILGMSYVNRFIIAVAPSPFVPTPTATRAPEAYISEAEELFKQGKLLQAVDKYKEALAVRPDDPAIHVALARVQVWAGEYKDAQHSAEDALLLNPNNSMAHAVRAWALDFQGNLLEAEAAIKRALELDPNNALAHAYYAEILVDTGSFENIEKAIEESRVAQALAPDSLETRRARGIVLDATANYEEAIREFQAAIEINGNISDLYLRLGLSYLNLGISDQAVDAFSRADALNPTDPLPNYYTSRTYAGIGEFAKALQFAETAVKDSPQDPRFRGNWGVMLYRNLYWPEAAEQLGLVVNGGITEDGYQIEAVNLVPNNPRIAEYYFTYGLALSRVNRCGEALQVAQTILARIPADQVAVDNAYAIISRCQQNLEQTPVPLQTPTAPDSASTEIPNPTP